MHRPPIRRPLTFSIILAALVLAGVPASLPAAAGDVRVELRPRGAVEVPQGAPFRFSAVVTNDTAEAKLVTIDLRVTPLGGETAEAFARWSTSVPAGGTARTEASVVTAQWFAQRGRFKISVGGDPSVIAEQQKFTVTAPVVRVPRFADITSARGLTADMPGINCGRWAAGAAWGDVEGDGDLDLYLPRQELGSKLWINDGDGHFADDAAARGVANAGSVGLSAVFADYDNDGDPDLYVGNHGPNRFYENDGSGYFTDVSERAGVAGDGSSSSASWGDYDEDGFIDLYVTNHTRCTTNDPVFDADKLYRNNGDGTFADVTSLVEGEFQSTSDGATTGAGFQGTWFDYDRDGDLDLLLANDFYGPNADRNHLWRNDGPSGDGGWTFTDVSVSTGMALRINAMGTAVGDYDHDGDLDVAITNIEDKVLMRNNGDGSFADVARTARVARPEQRVGENSITWGIAFADLNLDTWEDLYTGAGTLRAGPTSQANEVFVNGGKGKFFDLSAPSRADYDGITRGIALADFDRDGRIDVYIANQRSSSILYRNVTSKKNRHWLEIDTIGTVSNRDGCGAWLTLTVGHKKLVRQVFCGSISVASGSDPTVHFGLGRATSADKLVVEWPSGKTQVLKNLKVDRLKVVTEPSGM